MDPQRPDQQGGQQGGPPPVRDPQANPSNQQADPQGAPRYQGTLQETSGAPQGRQLVRRPPPGLEAVPQGNVVQPAAPGPQASTEVESSGAEVALSSSATVLQGLLLN